MQKYSAWDRVRVDDGAASAAAVDRAVPIRERRMRHRIAAVENYVQQQAENGDHGSQIVVRRELATELVLRRLYWNQVAHAPRQRQGAMVSASKPLVMRLGIAMALVLGGVVYAIVIFVLALRSFSGARTRTGI